MRIVLKTLAPAVATAVALAAGTALADSKLIEAEPAKPLANAAAVDAPNRAGGKTLEALLLRYPDLSKDVFIEADLDGDGLLSAEELDAAYARGLLPA